MDLDEFARMILFGSKLEEKLFPAQLDSNAPEAAHRQSFEMPDFPGRPEKLGRIGNAKFPATIALSNPTTRGQVLHFFANHELLAMELMAAVLLKFPDAPQGFRMGLARTIQEEQSHMRLYIERMRELGVDFGDLPLSDYFWNCLKSMRSPLEFVTQMSLTFEQANLDFSVYYRDQVAKHGDEKTAAILDRVYREEIGHVKHGLAWFNRWRGGPEQESDWDAYLRLLPPPLTARRAKGLIFCADARREAGFSESYIRELELNSGSKGRPPVVWFYNPACDAEIVRGAPGLSLPKSVQIIASDLEPLVMQLARDADIVCAKRRPRLDWLKTMSDAGFHVPEFLSIEAIKEPKLGGVEPWGWSPEALERLRPLKDKIIDSKEGRGAWARALLEKEDFQSTGLSCFFSKAWGAEFLRIWLLSHPETEEVFGGVENAGLLYEDFDSAAARISESISQGQAVAIKAPWGTSGNQVKRASRKDDLEGTLPKWIRNTIEAQKGVVIEPWLNKLHDLSIQIEVTSEDVHLFEAREFLTDAQSQYQGALLGRKFWGFSPEAARFFSRALPHWQKLARDLGKAMRDGGYLGPAGIDALIWKDEGNSLRFKPIVEVNPRWTMGRIALALENHIVPGTRAAWVFIRKKNIDTEAVETRFPPVFLDAENGRRIESGVFWTTDPQTSQELLTALVVGEETIQGARRIFHIHEDRAPRRL